MVDLKQVFAHWDKCHLELFRCDLKMRLQRWYKTMSWTFSLVFVMLILNTFHTFFSVSIVEFEQVNASCVSFTGQKMNFSMKDFFSKCDQIRSFLWIWSHLLKKSLMENFIFCAVFVQVLLYCSWPISRFHANVLFLHSLKIEIIHLLRSQNFPKNLHFLPLGTHTYVCVSSGKKCYFFGKFCERNKRMILYIIISLCYIL